MDVIEPCLVWVNGGCYRFFESNIWSTENFSAISAGENCDFQRINYRIDHDLDDPDDQEFDDDYNREFDNENLRFDTDNQQFDDDSESIAENLDQIVNEKIDSSNREKNGKIGEEKAEDEILVTPMPRSGYIHTFVINKRFCPIIIGRGGAVKQKLEMSTNTSIIMPRKDGGNEVEIKGANKEDVIAARLELDSIMKNARRFISEAEIAAYSSNNNAKSLHAPQVAKTQSYAGSWSARIENNTSVVPKSSNVYSQTKNAIDAPSAKFKSNITVDKRIDDSVPRSIPWMRKLYTHFISIPMTSDVVKSNFLEFTDKLLESANNHRGIRREIFRKPEKLHIALGMLTLSNESAVKAAGEALEECKQRIIEPIVAQMEHIMIRAQGLKGAFWEPYDINVLYSHLLSRNNVLQRIADEIADIFMCLGLMVKPNKEFKLHMTLMNVGFDKANPQRRFNVKNILKEYKNYVFGESELREIRISKRGDYDSDGYYATIAKISIP